MRLTRVLEADIYLKKGCYWEFFVPIPLSHYGMEWFMASMIVIEGAFHPGNPGKALSTRSII
jgi:hypothetical protein